MIMILPGWTVSLDRPQVRVEFYRIFYAVNISPIHLKENYSPNAVNIGPIHLKKILSLL